MSAFGGKADMTRTTLMSAFDPKRTLETTLCCSAQDRHLPPNRGSERVIALRSPSRTLPVSAGELGPLLLLGLLLCLGGGWELQHCCVLTFRKCGQKDLLTVRHFKDIVMDIWFVLVLLSEDGGRELALDALTFDIGPTKLDGFVEGKLGAGKNTNCRRITYRIVNRFESDGATSEIVAYQFVAHDCGA